MIKIANTDGSVIIDTLFDTNGFTKGVANIKSQFTKLGSAVRQLGVAIGFAFGLQQIVQFGKESSQAAMNLESSLRGLQSIVEGQGRSFEAAKQFIEEYTQDGLIPATNAITAYKNLASRGYDDTQIRQVMVALKDASAFGRQANYSMGEAVQSATEGLKNENSILVDNAGVTKNVAKMWQEYADSIGTTVNKLTQQQKIQAEVTGILAESKYQVGDAAIVANTLSGQLQQLSFNFNNLKVAVGGIVNPILQSLLPGINVAITALTKLANAIATVISLIFGKVNTSGGEMADTMDTVAGGYGSAADAAEDYGKAASSAADAAKKSLASFDELNKLQSESVSGGGGASGSASGGSGGVVPAGNIAVEAEVEDTISPKIQAIVNKIKELIEPLKNIDLSPAAAAFDRLRQAVEPITSDIFSGLEWAWYNILVPLAEWRIEDVLPAFLGLVTEGLNLLNTAIEGLRPLGIWLWDEFLKPMADWTGGVIVDSINGLADALSRISDWITTHKETINNVVILIGSIAGAFSALSVLAQLITYIQAVGAMAPEVGLLAAMFPKLSSVIATAAAWITGTLIPAVTTALGGIASALGISAGWVAAIAVAVGAAVAAIIIYWDEIVAWTKSALEKIVEIWNAAPAWFDENVVKPVAQFFSDLWSKVTAWAETAWAGMKAIWGAVQYWFQNYVVTPIANAFSTVRDVVSGIWDGIVGFIVGCINNIISAINGMISGIVDGINLAAQALNSLNFSIPEWVPGFGGYSFGFNIPQITAPQIPYLATGAVIPPNAPFYAVLGDQTHGRNLEGPEDLFRQIVREESGAVNFDRLAQLLETLISVVEGIEVGDETIGRAAARYNRSASRARGY